MRVPDPEVDDETFLDQVLDQALTARAEGRPLALEAVVAGREHLRPRIASLLGMAGELAPVVAPATPAAALGQLVGYTVLDEAGRGSMGIVYRARQEALGRVVALKVLAPALTLSQHARERFDLEARALSRVRHANVVAVHDVLASGEVCAYAMEWIEGQSLARALQPPARPLDPLVCARLGATLARALAAVHDVGLVHRDVKPSNVLLRPDGTPVLTDFSLVRDAQHSLHTATGEFVGTAAYAAPEQLRGQHDQSGPWTDVYGLAATLHAALAGAPPFQSTSTADVLRRIESGARAPLRRINPKVPRDLDTILAKAMDPEPSRRYPTASELAEDLERMLRAEPIRARRAGPALRLLRFVERSPQLALALLAVFVTLVLGLGVSVWFSFHLGVAEQQARDEAQIQHELAEYLRWVFRLGDATGFGVKDLTVVQALEQAEKAMGEGFSQLRPESRYHIHMMVVETFWGLGRKQEAMPHITRALEIARARYGPDTEQAAAPMLYLGRVQRDFGDQAAAEATLRDVVRIRREVRTPDRELAAALASLGILLKRQGRFAEAEAAYREAADRYRADLGPENENVADMDHNLATLLAAQRKFDEAERHELQALAILQRKFADGPQFDLANAHFGLGNLRHQAGRLEPGLEGMRKGVDMLRLAVGDKHPRFLGPCAVLAAALAPTAPQEAIARYQECVTGYATADAALACTHGVALADLLLALARTAEAEPVLVTALAHGAQTAARPGVLRRLGVVRTKLTQFVAAETALHQAWSLLGEGTTAEHRATADALAALYSAWHAAAPDAARAAKAKEWQERSGG